MRIKYWANSKFADKLRGVPKPKWGTPQEWKEWKETAKKRKIRYWLAEEGLDYIQDFFNLPNDTYHKIMYYMNNRWVTKTHMLKSTLPKGAWYDLDTRIIECLFNELVNFVEIELAWHHIMWRKDEVKEAPWWRRILRYRAWRSPSHGIKHLEWASALKDEQGKPTQQALGALEIKILYDWWKARVNRPDPYEVSGWTIDWTGKTDENAREQLDKLNIAEKQYEDEDTEMLIRLIKIRKNLWT